MSRPTDFFSYKGDSLHAGRTSLAKLAERYGTPLYVYSAEALLDPLRRLRHGLRSLDHLVCFAVKSNSNIAVLKLLSDAGAGADLVSGGELYRADKAGIAGNRVVFSGVGKTSDEMRAALAYDRGKGILSFNVESVAELQALDAVAGSLGKSAPVALRFNPDVNARTHPYISTGLKENKFGLNRKEVLAIAREHSRFKGIRIQGLSIHIGSQLVSLAPLEQAFRHAKKMMSELNHLLPEPLSIMDLGGGVGITYKNEKPPTIAQYCALVLKHFGPKAKLESPVKLLFEPGRLIAGNAGVLVSKVLYRKERGSKDFLVIDAAMNDLIRPTLYSSYHEIVPVRKHAGLLRKFDVVGPVCESSDSFASNRQLPSRLDSGHLVAILSTGAYGFTMSSNYNSRPRIPEILIEAGTPRVIRERETYDDLVRGEQL